MSTPPRTVRKPRGKSTDRKSAMLKSARELFLKRGYRLTTMEQIARHAGYSKRSVYLDYPNKDDLFVTIATEGLEILVEQLKAIAGTEPPLEELINHFLEAITVFSHEHGDYFKMLTTEVSPEVIANATPAVRERAMEIEVAGIKMMADAVEKAMHQGIIADGDAWEISEIFFGSVVGIITLSMGGSQAMFSYENMKAKVRKMGSIVYQGLSRRS